MKCCDHKPIGKRDPAHLFAIDRRPATPVALTPATIPNPAQDDLSAELRRCSALGPQDPEDARCVAV
ncbi:MAG: putative entry exclusion protein TrbK-alt, partial [Proteobacteria bacterium]|nr:putative entry exclusion protein TrbK-alt [Pseudomonadota bacterium]